MSEYARKRRILERSGAVGEKAVLPKCWLADLIHSQMATGNFAKMARDAIDCATRANRKADVELYRNMQSQIADYYSERGK